MPLKIGIGVKCDHLVRIEEELGAAARFPARSALAVKRMVST